MSEIENRFIQYQYEKKLPVEFNDRHGFSFRAKTDILFKDVYTGEVWIGELKMHELNSITSIRAAQNALFRQAKYRGFAVTSYCSHDELSSMLWRSGKDRYFCLNKSWNHSKTKQAIVSQTLKELGFNFCLIFSTHLPTIGKGRQEKSFKVHYQQNCKIRQVWLESEFREFEKSARFRPLNISEREEFMALVDTAARLRS